MIRIDTLFLTHFLEVYLFFFFSSRRLHTISYGDWSSDVCSSDLGWFWWGARHATPDEYRQLWRFTVEYLRDRRGVHNLLWAYSTDVFDTKQAYLERYPGDAYVDVLGFDDYQSVRTPATRDLFAHRLRDVVELAEARGKIPALTETGVEDRK